MDNLIVLLYFIIPVVIAWLALYFGISNAIAKIFLFVFAIFLAAMFIGLFILCSDNLDSSDCGMYALAHLYYLFPIVFIFFWALLIEVWKFLLKEIVKFFKK